MGCNDTTYRIRTHLGHLLAPGDMALGYDMVRYASSAGLEQNGWLQHQSKGRDRHSTLHVPDVILVKKDYEDNTKKRTNKNKNDKSSKRRHRKLKKQVVESVDDTTKEDDTKDDIDDVFSFPNSEETLGQLSVLNECPSEDEKEEEEEDDDDGEDADDGDDEDGYFGEGVETELEDDGDLEGLFSHLVAGS